MAASSTPSTDELTLHPATLLRFARKNVLYFSVCWLAIFVLVVFWTLGQSKTYRAEAMIRLDPDPPRPLGQRVELVSASANYWNHREFFESEFKVMRSLRVATAVVRLLSLNTDSGFITMKTDPKPTSVSVDEAAQILLSRLTVEPVKDSALVYIRFEDVSATRARTVLSAVVRTYLTQNLDQTAVVSQSALEWLNGQLDHLKTDLEKSETALNDFREKNNVVSLDLSERHNIIAAQLELVSHELTTMGIKRSEVAARNAEMSTIDFSQPDSLGANEFLQSTVLGLLRTARAEHARSLDELTATLGDEHPKVIAAKAKLAATNKAVAAEVANIRGAARRELASVDRQVADLKAKETEFQRQAHELQGFDVPYSQLLRTKNYNEKIYGIVLERARETDLTRMMNFNNVRVIDEPIEPRKPFRPNVPINLSIGFVVALVAGLAVAVGRELSDRTIKTPSDVENYIGVACVGVLPAMSAEKRRNRKRQLPLTDLVSRDLIVAQRPDSGTAEAARAIRTNIAFMSPDRPYRALTVTSAVPEEGKTTVACSIAIALAQGGHRVLIVDTDLRRPRLHRTFRIHNDIGVTMAVSKQTSLDECIRETSIENLWVLTAGPIPPNPAEILDSERFGALTHELRERFDRIIFDSPPVLPVTDAAILSRWVDGTLLVARGFRTPRTATRMAAKALRDVKANILGVVLNAIDFGRFDYKEYHYYYKRDAYYSTAKKESVSEVADP